MRIGRALLVALVTSVMLASCNTSDGAPATAGPAAPSGAQGDNPGSGAPAQDVVQRPSREFLNLVCPTDSAVQTLGYVAAIQGGWKNLSQKQAEQLASTASDAAREVARQIPEKQWPETIAVLMPEVAEEYLAMIPPLGQIAGAASGEDRSTAWRQLQEVPRTAEQRVRIQLNLGPAATDQDDCPPALKVKPNQTKPQTSGSGSNNAAASLGWTDHWRSPKGNIKCGYNPRGSRGVAVIACMVVSDREFMRMHDGSPPEGPIATKSNDAAQIDGSPMSILNYGQTKTVGGEFACYQSSETGTGMACWSLRYPSNGFTVSSGTFLSYPVLYG